MARLLEDYGEGVIKSPANASHESLVSHRTDPSSQRQQALAQEALDFIQWHQETQRLPSMDNLRVMELIFARAQYAHKHGQEQVRGVGTREGRARGQRAGALVYLR